MAVGMWKMANLIPAVSTLFNRIEMPAAKIPYMFSSGK